MAESQVLALDISEDAVSGVLLGEGKRALAIHAAHCRLYGAKTDINEALSEVVEKCGAKGASCLAAFDARHFHYRSLHFPFDDQKKVLSVLPFEIQDNVAFAGEPFLYDCFLGPGKDGGTDVLAVLVKKRQMRSWLDLLLDHDLDPELITVSGFPAAFNLSRAQADEGIDFLLLNVGVQVAALILVRDRKIKAVRTLAFNSGNQGGFSYSSEKGTVSIRNPNAAKEALDRLAIEVRNTLLALEASLTDEGGPQIFFSGLIGTQPDCRNRLLKNIEGKQYEGSWRPPPDTENMSNLRGSWPKAAIDPALQLACNSARDRDRINFRKDEFAWGGRTSSYVRMMKYGALGFALLVIGLIVYQIADYQNLKHQNDSLAEQIVAMYQNTLPGSKPGQEPVRELQIKVNELKDTTVIGTGHDPSITAVKLLADISERIPDSMQVSFERYIYDRESVRIRGVTNNFNTVDMMKKALEKSPFFSDVVIGSANVAPKEQGVRFELRLDL